MLQTHTPFQSSCIVLKRISNSHVCELLGVSDRFERANPNKLGIFVSLLCISLGNQVSWKTCKLMLTFSLLLQLWRPTFHFHSGVGRMFGECGDNNNHATTGLLPVFLASSLCNHYLYGVTPQNILRCLRGRVSATNPPQNSKV